MARNLRVLASLGFFLLVSACATVPPSTESPSKKVDLRILRDVAFAMRGKKELRADVYRAAPGRLPGVVVIHPGGWFSGDKGDVSSVARRFAEQGYLAVAPQYRLTPRHRFPAQIHDVKEAVRWMRANADELELDPERIAAYGYSAGGHLAALLAVTGAEDGLEGPTAYPGVSSRVQALVAGGSPTDLFAMRPNPAIAGLLGGSADDRPALARSASPLHFVTPDDPPAFLYHGRFDVLVGSGQSRGLWRALQRVRVPAQLRIGRLGHFTTWLFGGGEVERGLAFLDRLFRPAPGELLARDESTQPIDRTAARTNDNNS